MCYNYNSSHQEFLIWYILPLPSFLSYLTLLKCYLPWVPSPLKLGWMLLSMLPQHPVLTALPSPLDRWALLGSRLRFIYLWIPGV